MTDLYADEMPPLERVPSSHSRSRSISPKKRRVGRPRKRIKISRSRSPSPHESDEDPEDHIPLNLPSRSRPTTTNGANNKIQKIAYELNSLTSDSDFIYMKQFLSLNVLRNLEQITAYQHNTVPGEKGKKAAETRKKNALREQQERKREELEEHERKEQTKRNRKQRISPEEEMEREVLHSLVTSREITPLKGYYIGISVLAGMISLQKKMPFEDVRTILVTSFNRLELEVDAKEHSAPWTFKLLTTDDDIVQIYKSQDTIRIPYAMNASNFERIREKISLEQLNLY